MAIKKNSISIKQINLLLISFVILSLYSISFVSAVHNVTNTTTLLIQEDVSSFFNITVNNTDAGQNANITVVNITFPVSFTFPANTTNGTSAVGNTTLLIDNRTLSFSNTSAYLINGSTAKNFWINITALTPGVFNITVKTVNITSTYTTNLSITINDTTAPSAITFQNQTPSNATNVSNSNISVNISVTDNLAVSTIRVYLSNSTGLVNSTNTTSNPGFINFSSLADAIYYLNATANDTTNNVNTSSGTLVITLDTTAPTINLTSPVNGTNSTDTAHPFLFNVSSDLTGVANCSLIFDGSIINTTTNDATERNIYNDSLGLGTHNWSINCTDSTGNRGSSSTRILTISSSTEDDDSDDDDDSAGGSSSVPSIWKNTFVADDKELKDKGTITRDLIDKGRIRLKVNSKQHFVGIKSLSLNSAKIEVSSTPQEATFNVGDSKKFDVDGDNYYDILVRLISISNNKAKISIESIRESMIIDTALINDADNNEEATQEEIKAEQNTDSVNEANTSINKSGYLWTIIAIIVVGLIAAFYYMRSKKKRR